ncbi:uncharacterized protein LOC118648332 [Monomorium pharaonis]|uniref:uncharacterized protein LOC118648332 n=1 Tax=Monomorium pharaonis TaxID=307658 RepID=UPI001746A4A1|nr:uncharacterized protein LOC118648332 [Monomorium pharaonis]
MLQFMEKHPDLAQNRVQGTDAKKKSNMLWEQLTSSLNSCGSGTTKTVDKWIKSWRDWRVDVKAKATRLKSYQKGTGGGGANGNPLLEIEERLISLIEIEAAIGHENIIDPAEVNIFKFII